MARSLLRPSVPRRRRRDGPASVVAGSFLFLFSGAVTHGATHRPGAASAGSEPEKAATFAPGVRIDWSKRVVEVDAEVVLRDGPLELFACSRKTREHESVVVTSARPMYVFQAMGLIGLKAGSPVRYDPEHDRVIPSTGEALDLRVRFRSGNEERIVPIEAWMLETKRHQPPDPIPWVFAGSRTFANGRFGADVDGTVICVVDFDSAIISAGTLHTADNAQLWLTANTKAIPPVATPCTLLIRSAQFRPIRWLLLPGGRVEMDGGRATDIPTAIETLGRPGEASPGRGIVVTVASGVPDIAVAKLVVRLRQRGWKRDSIELKRAKPATPYGPSGRAP